MFALLDGISFGFANHFASELAKRKDGSLGVFAEWPACLISFGGYHLI